MRRDGFSLRRHWDGTGAGACVGKEAHVGRLTFQERAAALFSWPSPQCNETGDLTAGSRRNKHAEEVGEAECCGESANFENLLSLLQGCSVTKGTAFCVG